MEAPETTTPVETQPQQQQPAAVPAAQTPGCPGNCKRCPMLQQTYCAAQISYRMQNAIASLYARLVEIQESVAHLSEEVTALKKQSEEPSAIIEAPTPDDQPKKKKPASK